MRIYHCTGDIDFPLMCSQDWNKIKDEGLVITEEITIHKTACEELLLIEMFLIN